MSIWMVLGAAGVVSLMLLYLGFLEDRSRGRPRCPKCWYNMTGAPSLVCPECGHDARQSRRLYRTRRRRWAIPCAVLLVVMWAYLWQVRVRVVELRESLAGAWKPTSYLLLRLPHSSSEDQRALGNRIERSGLWPWESWTFLLHFNRQVSAASPGLPSWVHLARPAAGHSPRVLDRMVELSGHNNPAFQHFALRIADEQASLLSDGQLLKLLEDLTKQQKTPFWSIQRLLSEMVRRDRAAMREATRRIVQRIVDRCGDPDPNIKYGAMSAAGTCAACLSDHELSVLLDQALSENRGFFGANRFSDMFLAEMIRRKHPQFREQIARWVADPPVEDIGQAVAQMTGSQPADDRYRTAINLELVTALRRLDGQPDPLRIFVEGAPRITCRAARLPTVQLTIRNVDVEGKAIGFQRGGDYRSGRSARWRFDVRHQQGFVCPVKPNPGGMGGGLCSFDMLKPGETYDIKLDMNQFLKPLPPGRYRVVVQYHNSHTIADDEDVSNRIMSVSEPFELIVRP